jgi:hypothetical protein
MAKYGPRIFPSDLINTKGHWAVDTEWYVSGSKGNIYTIKMTDKGFTCDCPAFKKCKHIKLIEEKFEDTLDEFL